MASIHHEQRRSPSRLIALATVAMALAAAPAARADDDYDWAGGAYSNWSATNWYSVGGSNRLTNADFGYSTYLNFGDYPASNTTLNDDVGTTGVRFLGFSSKNWLLNGSQLNFDENGSLNVSTGASDGGINVKITNDIHLVTDFGYSTTVFPLTIDAGSTLTLTGHFDNDGAIDKLGGGTLALDDFHNYTGGTNVDAGRLVDYFPHGNYRDSSELEFHSDADQTASGTLFGSGKLFKGGAGTLTLTGAVSYTGLTTVTGGRLILQVPQSSGIDVESGAAFETRMTQTATYAGKITGAGSYTKSGTGSMTLSALNDYTGGTVVAAGQLTDLHPHGDYQNSATLVFDVESAASADTGVISGSGTLSKVGAGALTLTGVNTYTGTTYVEGGRLIDQHPHGTYFDDTALEFQTTTDQTFSGGVFGGGSLTKSGAGTLTLSAQYNPAYPSYSGGTTVNAGRLIEQSPHGNYVTNADLEFANATDVYFWTTALNGPPAPNAITGTGNLTKSGAGSLLVFAPLGYGGITTVNGGAIIALANNTLPTSTALTLGANGSLLMGAAQTVGSLEGAGHVGTGGNAVTVSGASSTTFSGVVSDSGTLTKAGTGTLTLSGQNTYTGNTTVSGGTLREGVNYAINGYTSASVGAGATLDLNGHEQTFQGLTGAGAVALGGSTGSLYVHNTAAESFDGTISGAGIFTKTGAGALTLTGVNTYTGGTYSFDGPLIVTNPEGNYVAYAGMEARTATNQTLAGVVSGGSFTKSGAGTLTLTGVNTYAAGTTVSAGTLIDQHPHGDYVANATLEFQNAADVSYDGVVSGTGSFTKDGAGTLTRSKASTNAQGTLVLAGALVELNPYGKYDNKATIEFAPATDLSYKGTDIEGFGTFIKAGAGTLTLTSAITSSMAVQIASGTLKGTGQNLNHDVASTGGTLQFDDARSGAYSRTYSGSGALLKTGNGAYTLSKVPANTGGVRVSGGSVEVDGRGTMDEGLTVDAGATFANRANGLLTVAGRSSNQGAVNTFNGTTTAFAGPVSGAGNFTGTGKVEFDGGYSPGNSPASVSFAGGLTLGSANALTMELGGTTPGTGYDHLTVSGLTTLGGSLAVVSYNGFSPALGQSFDLFDLASSTGSFSSISLPTLANGLRWDTGGLYTDGTIRAVPEPAPLAALGIGALALLRRRKR